MARAAKQAAAVLISGGVDSAVLLDQMRRRYRPVHPLYVRSGLIWEPAERYWLNRFLRHFNSNGVKRLKVLDLPVQELYRSHWSTTGKKVPAAHSTDQAVYLPGRNLLLLCKAAIYASMERLPVIAMAPLSRNPFPDGTAEFFRAYEQVLSKALNFSVSIETPFLTRKKSEIILLGKGLPLELTFSCLNPMGRAHCGSCNKCEERRRAFKEAGQTDRTVYARPWKS